MYYISLRQIMSELIRIGQLLRRRWKDSAPALGLFASLDRRVQYQPKVNVLLHPVVSHEGNLRHISYLRCETGPATLSCKANLLRHNKIKGNKVIDGDNKSPKVIKLETAVANGLVTGIKFKKVKTI